MKKIFKNIGMIIAVLIGLSFVFYAGMTFNKTLYIDCCIDNGGIMEQGVKDTCVFERVPEETNLTISDNSIPVPIVK